MTLPELWAEIAALIGKKRRPCIIHYAGFETPFLKEIAGDEGDRLDIYCTFEMARRLIPELPSRSLRALSGYLGYPIDTARRCAEHVAATAFIWQRLSVMATEQHGITDFDGLRRWLLDSAPGKAKKKSYALSAATRLALPSKPGIYRFRDARGRILYIGKAQDLRARVNSYFRGQRSKGARLNELTSLIAAVDVDVALNPLHACLMENDRIKEHLPPYNRALLYGKRAIGFMTNDFAPCDAAHPHVCYGPFSAMTYVEHLAGWMALINDPNHPLPETLPGGELDAAVIAGGASLFRLQHGLSGPLDRKAWRSLLVRLWIDDLKRRLAEAETKAEAAEAESSANDMVEGGDGCHEDDVDDATEEPLVEEWTEQNFAVYLARVLCGLARRIARGRQLRRLAWGRLIFHYNEDSWHILDMHGSDACFSASNVQPALAWATSGAPTGLERFSFIDIKTYDRLTILHAEMRRMSAAGLEMIWCRPYESLQNPP